MGNNILGVTERPLRPPIYKVGVTQSEVVTEFVYLTRIFIDTHYRLIQEVLGNILNW